MMDNDSILNMYNEMMNTVGTPDYSSKSRSKRLDVDDETEIFVTSVEASKEEKSSDNKFEGKRNVVTGEMEETAVFKRYTTKRKHKYTQTEMKKIREECKTVIVNDYGENDIYHMSDEDKLKNDQLADIAIKLGGVKRIYRRVDQYIEAMRIVYQAWDILAKNNYIHTKEEFFDLVASGNIVSGRIIQPKLKRADDYNMDKIIQYISDHSLDPKDLLPVEYDPYDQFYTDEEYEEEQARLLSAEEIQHIINYDESENKGIRVKDIKWKYLKDTDVKISKKKKKKLKKSDRILRKSISDITNKINNGNHYNDYGYSYLLTNDIFKKESNKTIFDDVPFDGSWADKDAVELYNLVLNESLKSEKPENEQYLTYADRELQEFYNILEKNGLNTIELRRRINGDVNKYDVKKQKANKKENRRIENALLNRINKLSKDPKFKKLVNKAEKKLSDYHKNENE